MAVPTAVTLRDISVEALSKAGYSSPATTQATLLARAENMWMREIKNDITKAQPKLLSLQSETIQNLVIGRSRYNLPTDFLSLLSMTLLDGTHTGTATAGAAGSITFAADEDVESDCTGKEVVLTSGTGVGQSSQIYSYNSTTKVASVYPEWTTNPTSGTGYLVVDRYSKLSEHPVWEYDKEAYKNRKGEPTEYYPIGNSTDGEFLLVQAPDETYAIKIRYYADLMRIDLTDTLMSTLYRKWQNVWMLGLWFRALRHQDDPTMETAKQEYISSISSLVMREGYEMDLSNIVMRVSEE